MKKENLAIIELLVCAALWSIAGIFMKLIPWNGFAVAGGRSLIAGLTIGAYMRLKRLRFHFNRRTLIAGVLTGCVYICFTVANKLTTAANAIVLQFTNPAFIILFSALFLHKKVRRADLAVVLASLVGIALFFFDQLAPGYLLGNVVAIGAGMFFAAMFMTLGGLETEERYSAVVIGQSFTFLVGLPFLLLTKPELSSTALLSLLILGVLQLGLPYILYVKGSNYCPPLACSLLTALEPLLNPVWVLLFNGEKPGPFALVGGAIVIVSVTLWCIFGQEKKPEAQHA